MKSEHFLNSSPGHLVASVHGAKAFVPDPLPPHPSSFDRTECAELAEYALMALGGLKTVVETVPNTSLLIDSFMRREAVRSSHIEGTQTELGQLLLFELSEPADQAMGEDADQVQQNFKAFKRGLELVEKLPVSGRLFREIHAVLFEGYSPIEKSPGKYRKVPTMIGARYASNQESFQNARFIPPPDSYVQQAMKELEEFINLPKKYLGLPVLVQLALIHYQFEIIHPFSDGNGRIGRLAVSLLLKSRGLLPDPILCLSAYMDSHRETYVDRMLAVSQRGEWSEWVRFFLNGIKEQAEEDILRCKHLIALRDKSLALFSKNHIPLEVLDSLFRFPATTITRMTAQSGKTFGAGTRWADTLVEEGFLAEVTGRKSGKVYLSQPIIDLLEKQLPKPAASGGISGR